MNSWTLGLAIIVALFIVAVIFLTTGCVTAGKVETDIGHSLTPEQRAEASMLEVAIENIRAKCAEQVPAVTCTLPWVVVSETVSVAVYRNGSVFIPPQQLHPAFRPLVAHELAHHYFSDARNCRGERLVVCERNGNVHGIQVLMVGYGYDLPTAARLMHAYLVVGVTVNKPLPGHPDACAELHDFERRVSATPDTL
jgi:hypothetical protein